MATGEKEGRQIDINDAHGMVYHRHEPVQRIGGVGILARDVEPGTPNGAFSVLNVGAGPDRRPESFVSPMEEQPSLLSTKGAPLRPDVVRTSDAGNAIGVDGSIPGYTTGK